MSSCHIESGIQFLTRIKSMKSNLQNLENNLFVNGLKPTDVIEFSSETNFGKTQTLLHLLKNALLIDKHNDLLVGGLNTGVLFIDTDFHFQISLLSEFIKKHIKQIEKLHITEEEEDEIVKKSLKNLSMIRCFDSQQLLVTFHSLNTLFTSNANIKFVVLDSIGANYWQDFMNEGIRKMDLYEKKVLSAFENCIKDFKLLILYVRPEFLVLKNPAGSSTADFKLRVRVKDASKNILEATVTSKDNNSSQKSFMAFNNEIIWLS